MENTKNLIQKYYDYFNNGDMQQFLSLLQEDVVHDINQGTQETGKNKFALFMEHMNQCYKEKIRDVKIMLSHDNIHAAAEFIVDGIYQKTDKGLPEAKGQKYSLRCGAFFEIQNNKIARVTNYYNLNKWLRLVSQ